jgi:hypothetical protein
MDDGAAPAEALRRFGDPVRYRTHVVYRARRQAQRELLSTSAASRPLSRYCVPALGRSAAPCLAGF